MYNSIKSSKAQVYRGMLQNWIIGSDNFFTKICRIILFNYFIQHYLFSKIFIQINVNHFYNFDVKSSTLFSIPISDKACDVQIEDYTVLRQHAQIKFDEKYGWLLNTFRAKSNIYGTKVYLANHDQFINKKASYLQKIMANCIIGFGDEALIHLKTINENEAYKEGDVYDSDVEVEDFPQSDQFLLKEYKNKHESGLTSKMPSNRESMINMY